MTVVLFDTLKLARRLEGAGFTHEQADGAAAALAETVSGEMATKSDIAEIWGDLTTFKSDAAAVMSAIGKMRSNLTPPLSEAQALRLEFQLSRIEFKDQAAEFRTVLRTEFASLRSSTARWIIGMAFVNTLTMLGVAAAVWQITRH
jgi:hypothetical protein